MDFSVHVKQARQQLGLTQTMLAKELSVSFSSINRWERGHTMPPQLFKNVFYDYCKKHDVNFSDELIK